MVGLVFVIVVEKMDQAQESVAVEGMVYVDLDTEIQVIEMGCSGDYMGISLGRLGRLRQVYTTIWVGGVV